MPEEGTPLYNPHGTAPGFIVTGEENRATVIALPGPRREWRPMYEKYVEPFLRERFHPTGRLFTKTIHTIGLPESTIGEKVKSCFDREENVNITLLAKPGNVDVRINVEGKPEHEAKKIAEALALSLIHI